jgi:very-short-patch-repair endonuclease
MARCKFCGKEIVWMQEGRKKVPVEVDGIKHECEAFKKSRDSLRKVDLNTIDPDVLKQYQDAMNKKKKK